MIQNFKYFVWGSAIKNKPLYGLYNQVVDCFLLVTPDYYAADKLKTILSSRYELLTVELSLADNFALDLIDNTVCTQWSFKEKNQIKIGKLSFQSFEKIIRPKTLCAAQEPLRYELEQEQEYALMCQHWINFINQQKNFIDNIQKFNEFLPLPELGTDTFSELSAEIYRIMYLGEDLEQVDQHIATLIENNNLLFFTPVHLPDYES